MELSVSIQAALWGLFSGFGLVLGALLAYWINWPKRAVAAVMAFGSGVLISAISFDLMDEAVTRGGFISTAIGFLAGAAIYTVTNVIVNRYGAKHRKRSGEQQPSEGDQQGSGTAIAIGAVLDGIPESIVLGLGLLEGHGIGVAVIVAIFLSNVPEGLSSVAGMRQAGRSATYIFGLWIGVALITSLAAYLGYTAFAGTPPEVVAAVMALAAGAMLAMLVDTMIPEAFESAHDYAGMIAVLGFITAFAVSRLAEGG